jgi:hypothetical protein
MKLHEFRNLIRAEVRKVLKESNDFESNSNGDEYFDFEEKNALNFKSSTGITKYLNNVEDLGDDGYEGQLSAIKEAGYKLKELMHVDFSDASQFDDGVTVFKMVSKPYVIVSDDYIGSASLFKESDLPKLIKALGVKENM